ncbi:MAG: TrkA C-terminal domain-containing protein [Methanomicrobiales archaeon]|nr:TrkA C-terminal domain-containing protein [Methanomicrobiales archaeon]MDI6876161.1 TrkA C-terminal domain-containing protein [Methanomicrobiales archaeon]
MIASIALSDRVAVLLDLPDRRKVIGKQVQRHLPASLGEVERRSGAVVLGIEREGEALVRPPSDTRIEAGDTVIVLGRNETLKRFIRMY